MRSAASVAGHPLHPMLIPFPVAFLVGAVAFDLLGLATDRATFWHTAGHLLVAGLVTGVVAAMPGAVDYFRTVPPASSGRRRAQRHALANAAALGLFGGALAVRGLADPPGAGTLALELAGLVSLGYGGWLGGTLVTRNLIGVDHRYANAGRWREVSVSSAGRPLRVAATGELAPGQMKLIHVDGRRVALARTAEGYCAFDDRCPHRGGSLAGGVLAGGIVHCLWHGSQFDCRSGRVVSGPAQDPIHTYEVVEVGRDVQLRM
ncbi:MAG TPA: DUF2231 domain-containing protein [Vicinamibacterales bacterium]|nr:DUF2231 domain-containing protein [Vicinamibacterales bacterium]